MKKLLIVAVFVAGSFAGMAQKSDAGIQGFKVAGGIDLAIPANNMGGTSIGAGVDLLGQYGVSENFGITVDAGYTALFLKGGGNTEGLIPIRAGIRYYPSSQWYVGGKAGIGILTGGGSSLTTTAYSFGGGYMISPKLDLGATYDGYSKSGSFGLVNVRLGYFFGN
ncbi:MAG: outer membrane beta-barrel protein [Bacteroidetes bacterium]|nr:outer membrane beta-barrel protein [Bacteroidota bacterium]MBS1758066.1 outer membrane beta-barrel protein [Bacteroidota bacterium]